MRGRFRHAEHVLRVAALFAFGFIAFAVVRSFLVPSDFGVLGFYRAGALDDIKARPIAYTGRAACEECHAGIYDPADDAPPPEGGERILATGWPVEKEADNKHYILSCDSCHGPLAAHAEDPEKPVPEVGKDKLCLTCHLEVTGRPKEQPQVLPGDHGENDPCVSCHRPHRPRTDEDEQQ